MRFLYTIQPIADYCSYLWAPTKYVDIDALEAIPRAWSNQALFILDFHPWDRLRILKIPSVQRRLQRYHIIVFGKILEGLTLAQGGIKGVWRD